MEQWFSDICFVVGDVKVRDYCYVTGKCTPPAHRNCNINVGLN